MTTNDPTGDTVPGVRQLRTLRGALEHSVTVQRERLQEIVDDLVSRGALSAAEANKLVENLLTSSKTYSAALLQMLESATSGSRRGLGARVAPMVATAGTAAGKVAETVMAAPKLVTGSGRSKSEPSAEPSVAPERAASEPSSAPGEPIPCYTALTVAQIRPSLAGLSPEELRRVRDTEASGKKRKSLLAEIDKLLDKRAG